MAWRNAPVTLDRIEDGRLYLQVGPEGFSLDVRDLRAMVLRGDGLDSGTPTGNLRGRLYNGTTLLATSQEVYTLSQITGGTFAEFTFATVQVIAASTAIRLVLGETTQSASTPPIGTSRIPLTHAVFSRSAGP